MNRFSQLVTTALIGLSSAASAAPAPHWVASWQASPQPVWGPEFLFPTLVPAALQDQTFRQTARISLGGSRLRVRLSNAYGTQPLRIGAASVAARAGDTPQPLSFEGQPGVLIGPGQERLSDPLPLATADRQALQVSVFVPGPMPVQTFHWEGRQTSWIAPGDQSQAQTLNGASSTTARLFLAGIEVEAPTSARSVVVIGDSITDGATASLDQDQRWTDHLAARLAPRGIAVVNAGISGGRLLHDGMGESAPARFQRDVLDQPGVSSVIVLIGINDISWPGTAFARKQARPALAELQAGYRALAEQAHRRGLRILGATLMPFAGALPGTPLDDYYHSDKDALRRQLNAWLRTDGPFDAVIDLDAALRDPADPSRMAAAYDSGDHLHPGDAGNRAMAEAVDLDVLLGGQGSAGVGSLCASKGL
ncbi:TPA: SGNH/GDSL hydrolase family protein [Stenotrophomonas maltophilia]|jgi:lysophospholipase L1-like esterase|uniref:SGNH/GDSL hydrolase family protein n=1 Tax=Stenotrophomonas TaxID=40323 RepID=UPI0009781745|nr:MULTISPECIES: SGNH/GDSL hydrolase family protein [Stenotrophomonas]MCV4212641.1 SGNH/GDSL hydrolase family protein [Pseudomonas cichorii]EKT4067385.1 SGNH/GDSL hydrolase family protein [Stenotrophomonas maltophilia]EKT4068907.1 SGNH/GDSL hydrolase family protein [Stenotrophomonas maltophilia]MBA0238680.1 SGNH/GDSL hydrolase family protein [Stenotrophomonas maltophilia]MBH1428062.1 SGNH/GDSL hydrolase family protein [Stenotrophomonas maltophilia]